MNLREIAKIAGKEISKNAPSILTGLGILGMYISIGLAVKATPKAEQILHDYQTENGYFAKGKFPKKLAIKLTWKEYIPSAVTSLGSVCCFLKANQIHGKRQAALMGLYSLASTALSDYQGKVKEMLGDGKHVKIQDNVAQDKLDKTNFKQRDIIMTGNGDVLCYDAPSGRYFMSQIETIKRKENELNQRLRTDMLISANELYYELGLGETKTGESVGWNIDKGLLTFRYSSHLNEHQQPCLVIDYEMVPLFPVPF